MSRSVRLALLAFFLVLLSAAPGPATVVDAASELPRTEVSDPVQLSPGLPVARSVASSSVGDRGVTPGRPDVLAHLTLLAVLPTASGVRPIGRSWSVDASGDDLAGTVAGCATGRAPPTSH